jgi:hypothetical protein
MGLFSALFGGSTSVSTNVTQAQDIDIDFAPTTVVNSQVAVDLTPINNLVNKISQQGQANAAAFQAATRDNATAFSNVGAAIIDNADATQTGLEGAGASLAAGLVISADQFSKNITKAFAGAGSKIAMVAMAAGALWFLTRKA